MGIRELGEKLGISPSTIKKYEIEFGISVQRNELGHRIYGENEIYIYELIMRMKNMGANIHTIKKILIKEQIIKNDSKSLEIIDYNKELESKNDIRKYTAEEISQLTKTLKEIQQDYITSLKHELKTKDELIESLQRQLEIQTEIIKDFKDIMMIEHTKTERIEESNEVRNEGRNEAKAVSFFIRLKAMLKKN